MIDIRLFPFQCSYNIRIMWEDIPLVNRKTYLSKFFSNERLGFFCISCRRTFRGKTDEIFNKGQQLIAVIIHLCK
ncbi:hypothetical protein AOA57_27845 [Pseudomonas sp. 2588-5]|nr:hypothetical protein AOA57_27845 [Pseudomonas sp. 2588-5]